MEKKPNDNLGRPSKVWDKTLGHVKVKGFGCPVPVRQVLDKIPTKLVLNEMAMYPEFETKVNNLYEAYKKPRY